MAIILCCVVRINCPLIVNKALFLVQSFFSPQNRSFEFGLTGYIWLSYTQTQHKHRAFTTTHYYCSNRDFARQCKIAFSHFGKTQHELTATHTHPHFVFVRQVTCSVLRWRWLLNPWNNTRKFTEQADHAERKKDCSENAPQNPCSRITEATKEKYQRASCDRENQMTLFNGGLRHMHMLDFTTEYLQPSRAFKPYINI